VDLITTATSSDESSRGASIAVLPIGSFEQHGAHLPLITDTIVACTVAKAVAEQYHLLLLPPVTISCSHEHTGWPGTVSISAVTLAAVIADIATSLTRSGIPKLVLVNGHGGNYVLSNIVQEATVTDRAMTLFPGRDAWDRARVKASLTTNGHEDMHAGELETSLLLHAYPQVVREGNPTADHDAPNRPHLLTLGMRGYTDSGVIGRPSLGTAEKGKAILESLVASFDSYLHTLQSQ
jgi:creatinine amidohydrolase